MIENIWYKIRDFFDNSNAATFFIYCTAVGIGLATYVALVTASLDYIRPTMTPVIIWAVLAVVFATIRAVRTHRGHL